MYWDCIQNPNNRARHPYTGLVKKPSRSVHPFPDLKSLVCFYLRFPIETDINECRRNQITSCCQISWKLRYQAWGLYLWSRTINHPASKKYRSHSPQTNANYLPDQVVWDVLFDIAIMLTKSSFIDMLKFFWISNYKDCV